MPQFFHTQDNVKLGYQDEGAGLPLLCLAGLTRTMADFDYLKPHLPPLRLIRMDYRGRGASAWAEPASYTPLQEAADAIALMDHLGIDRCAVLGTSRGGIVGMCLAHMVPDRITGLALNDVGPVLERPGLQRIFTYLGRNPAAKTHEELAQKLPAYMPEFKNVPHSRWLEEARKHYIITERGLGITYDPALRGGFIKAFENPTDGWPLFTACAPLPMLLLRGENSDLLAQNTAMEMQQRCPDMALTVVKDRGHIPFLDEPEAIEALHHWLRRCV